MSFFKNICRVSLEPGTALAMVFWPQDEPCHAETLATLAGMTKGMAAFLGEDDADVRMYRDGLKRLQWAERQVASGLLREEVLPVMEDAFPLAYREFRTRSRTVQAMPGLHRPSL